MKQVVGLMLLIIPIFIYADSLKSLLEYSQKNNDLIVSKSLSRASKASEAKSAKSDYYPTIDVGAFYKREDKANPILPGSIYSGYTKIGFDVYDGARKSHTLKQKRDELKASDYDYKETKKEMALSIVQDFYNIKIQDASLRALKESLIALKAQLARIKQFFHAKLATSDDVDKLQSSYDKDIYLIESKKFVILSLKRALELKVGKKIHFLESSKFKKEDNKFIDETDDIKALKATKSSIVNASEVVQSNYYPQVRVEDTYNVYGYENIPSIAGFTINQIYNQNTIMATLNMRIFDFDAIGELKESLRLKAEALNKQIIYKTKEQEMQRELSKERIKTALLNIQSSKSAMKASTSALKTITQKYNNAIVDNIVYLDALSTRTEAKSTYEAALNNLEIAYALYYYYNAKNLEEFLDD